MLGSRVRLPQSALTLLTLDRPQAYKFMYYDITPHFTEVTVEINVLVHWGVTTHTAY